MATKTGLLSVSIADAYGIKATTDAFITIDDTKTVAQLVSDAADWVATVNNLSQGLPAESRVTIIVSEADTTGAAGDVEKGGLFSFNNASDPYAQGYWIPDINPAVLNASGLIDLTDTNVTDFITFMTTAHTTVTVVTKGVRALTALKDAMISFRKKRKPLSRKTTEAG